MSTVEELARQVIGDVADDGLLLSASRWISNRYKELASKIRFGHLRKVGYLSIPAVVDDGTVTVSRGSTTVTGDATAKAAWSSSLVGYHFRARRNWYLISAVDTGAGTLTLSAPFGETDVEDGSYKIVKRHHALSTSVQWLGAFIHQRSGNYLRRVNVDELDRRSTTRWDVSGLPRYVAYLGTDSNHAPVVEIYPYPSNQETIRYIYYERPSDLSLSDTVPPQVPENILREGALVDFYRYKATEAAEDGRIDAASFWRNEYRAQTTVWSRLIQEAAMHSESAQDMYMEYESIFEPGTVVKMGAQWIPYLCWTLVD